MSVPVTVNDAPVGWLELLAEAEADIAADHTVPWSEAIARLFAEPDESDAKSSNCKA